MFTKKQNFYVKPMGAVLLEKNLKKLKYPVYAQPKIDGFRGLAGMKNNNVIIYSRTGKELRHLSEIKKELKKNKIIKENKILDGEIYLPNHTIGDLRSVMGRHTLNTNKSITLEKKIKYFVFDYIDLEKTFEERYNILKKSFKKMNSVKLVETKKINNEKDLYNFKNKLVGEGYEGIIVRNMMGMYEPGKKSKNVLMSKDFKQDKFTILDGIEGKGADKGTVIWKMQCNKDKNKFFMARPIGTKEFRKKLFINKEKYIGKKITIKYFEINKETGCVSRFPIAI